MGRKIIGEVTFTETRSMQDGLQISNVDTGPTWQERMQEKHAELMDQAQDQQLDDKFRRDGFERALRLEKILRNDQGS